MSNASSKESDPIKANGFVPWNPWLGVVSTILLFLGAQVAASLVIFFVPVLAGWSDARASEWLENSFTAQLLLFPLATAFMLVPLYFFLKRRKTGFRSIGFRRPKWSDPLWSILAVPVYIFLFAVSLIIAKALFPGLDINQAQDLGLNGSYNGVQLFIIFICLVILPPLSEETIFRGMLYSSLKKAMPIIMAAIVASLLFASGHLLQSGNDSLLYIAGIDTFVLSLILVFLREKTGGLWSPMGLHAIKNCIAFVSIFVLHLN